MVNIMTDFHILLSFIKIGISYLNGSDEFLPVMQRELCDRNRWMSKAHIEEIYIRASDLPGSLSLNSACISGMEIAGGFGSIFAVLGLILPSIIAIILIEILMGLSEILGSWRLFLLGIRSIIVGMTFFGVYRLSLTDMESHVDIVILLGVLISIIGFFELSALWPVLAGTIILLTIFIYSQSSGKGIIFMVIHLIVFALGGLKPFLIFSISMTLSFMVYILENSEGSRL